MSATFRKLIAKPLGVIVNSDGCHRDERRTHACQKYALGSVQAPLSPRKQGTICSLAFHNVQYFAVHFSMEFEAGLPI